MIQLYNTAQTRQLDSYAINELNIPSISLMENASLSIFHIINSHYKILGSEKTISIVCGKGNNGGDGLALARHFLNFGINTHIFLLYPPENFSNDTFINYNVISNLAKTKNISIIHKFDKKGYNLLKNSDIIIDAIFGTGFKGSLPESIDKVIGDINAIGCTKIAIDIPTGLDADTGNGNTIFGADLTITLGCLKKGLFFNKGYVNTGRIEKGYIGISDDSISEIHNNSFLITVDDLSKLIPNKSKDLHKYSAGKTLFIAGSSKYPGAAILSTTAALKSGCGAPILCFPNSVKHLLFSKITEPIILSYDDLGSGALQLSNVNEIRTKLAWANCIAIGPGLTRCKSTLDAVKQIIIERNDTPIIVDADALYSIADLFNSSTKFTNIILTPHHKEFADILNITTEELEQNIIDISTAFCLTNNCYLVLKGAPTIIFTPTGKNYINSIGNPGMAKFGTGDVLTGIIASFISQTKDIERYLIASVLIHSFSADLASRELTEYCFSAQDIINNLPKTFKALKNYVK